MTEIERDVGRLGIWAEAWVPTLQDLRLELNVWTDGITAGVTISLLWCSASIYWRWNHDRCRDCSDA